MFPPLVRLPKELVVCTLVALALLSVGGCSAIDLDQQPPQGFDLSGTWQLNSVLSDPPSSAGVARRPAGGNAGARPPNQGQGRRQGRGRATKQRGQAGGPAGSNRRGGGPRLPILKHTRVAIQQDYESLGMDFDGSGYRDVSWGQRNRGEETINAGWQEGDLVIQTKGGRRAILERYTLSEDGNRLTVVVKLDGNRQKQSFRRVFEKLPPQ